jgi:hypothetical protein
VRKAGGDAPGTPVTPAFVRELAGRRSSRLAPTAPAAARRGAGTPGGDDLERLLRGGDPPVGKRRIVGAALAGSACRYSRAAARSTCSTRARSHGDGAPGAGARSPSCAKARRHACVRARRRSAQSLHASAREGTVREPRFRPTVIWLGLDRHASLAERAARVSASRWSATRAASVTSRARSTGLPRRAAPEEIVPRPTLRCSPRPQAHRLTRPRSRPICAAACPASRTASRCSSSRAGSRIRPTG